MSNGVGTQRGLETFGPLWELAVAGAVEMIERGNEQG